MTKEKEKLMELIDKMPNEQITDLLDYVLNDHNGYGDETEYLLSSKANKQELLASIKQIKSGETVTISEDEFKQIKSK